MRLQYFTRKEYGFTLIELLISMAISGILLAATVTTFIAQQKSYNLQTQIADMTLNVRAAIDMMAREIRMAGYGVPPSQLSDWIDWVRDANGDPIVFTDSVYIAKDDTKPDALSIVGCFDPPLARVGADTGVRSTKLKVLYNSRSKQLNAGNKKVFYIGRNETGIVKSSSNSKSRRGTLNIDTDPSAEGNQGLAGQYSAGDTPVELLKVITYTIAIDTRNYDTPTPILRRNEHIGGGAQPLAEHIEDLRITPDGNTLIIALTGRTPKPDPTYRHPVQGDGYRRLTVTAQVQMRNLGL